MSLFEDLLDVRDEVGLRELSAGEVDAEHERFVGRGLPLPPAQLAASFAQHPQPDWHDQPRLFRHRDELGREGEAALRVLPAHERLEARKPSRFQRDDGLIIDAEFFALDGVP